MAQLLTSLNFGEMGALKSVENSDFIYVKKNNYWLVHAKTTNRVRTQVTDFSQKKYQLLVYGQVHQLPIFFSADFNAHIPPKFRDVKSYAISEIRSLGIPL